jgi:phytoene dehydrogenase-like protein
VRVLGRAGLDVLVLEARDRVGGRSWTDRFDPAVLPRFGLPPSLSI